MSYLIYARKYRPQTFEEIIGQKPLVQTLKNAIQNDRVAQAYIFSGMRGVGKTTAARVLAKALNCKEGPIPTPCNQCDFCREINEDRSLDVIEIDGASNTGVDDVRTLREGVQYKPIHCRYKIIIIDEIHMLSKSAFNALLKTLEEPPPSTIFIFATTEFHKVPATIVSRCQHFEFKRISQKEIIEHIKDLSTKENIVISTLGANLIAQAAGGSLRDAQSLLDQAVAFSGEQIKDEDLREILGIINQDILFQFSSAIMEEKPDLIFTLVEKVIDSGYDLRFFHEELIQHFRNLLLVRTVKNTEDLIPLPAEEIERLRTESSQASAEEILRYLMALQQGEQGLKFSSHPQIFLETLLVKLCHYRRIVPIKDLISQVQGLAKENPDQIENRIEPKTSPTDRKDYLNQSQTAEKNRSHYPVRENNLNQPKEESQPRENDTDKVLKVPAVQNFMDLFKAQIISVEKKKKDKHIE
jgi:DNA polymerase-3 subunit gamma/tau